MDLLEELREDFLTCNICFEEYRDPKQLPCLHTFCKQCLSKYIVGKVVETGAEWFPCPFCRKAIQPTQGGGVRTWADSFPSNFLLAQLSSKIQDRTAQLVTSPDDVTGDTDVSTREKCPDHPQSYLVGYCTRRRSGVCEECCVQKHTDCIRSHIKQRDTRAMAEERRSECQEYMGALQIKLEGVKDTLSSREADLTNRSDQLLTQTTAAVEDLKIKLDLFLADQRRQLSSRLDSVVTKEKTRLQSVRQQVTEVTEANNRVFRRLESLEVADLGVRDLVALDKALDDLTDQDTIVDRLRKDCVLTDIHFRPDTESAERALQAISIGQLVTGTEARALACGGARPRTPRYSADPATSPLDYSLQRSPHSQPVPSWAYPQSRGRAMSPPGGAASSASSATSSTAAGPTVHDYDVMKDRPSRQSAETTLKQKETHPIHKRTPTLPDFGAVLIEESRPGRSRSLPRRRFASEGSAVVGRKGRRRAVATTTQDKRGPPLETEITGDDDVGGSSGGRTTVTDVFVLERAPQVSYPPSSGQTEERDLMGQISDKGRKQLTEFERSVSSPPVAYDNHSALHSSDDEMFSDSTSEQRREGGRTRNDGRETSRRQSEGGQGKMRRMSLTQAELDLSVSDSDIGAVGSSRPGGGNTSSSPNSTSITDYDDDGRPETTEGGHHKSRRIACVRHFMTTHERDVKQEPGLVGISPVCENRVAVCDRWNKVVKLIDIAGRVLDVLSVSGHAEPWDLALKKPAQLAVTYPKEKIIRMIDVADGGSRLVYRSYFTTRDGYASLARYDNSSLIASVCPPFGSPKIHIIDCMGSVLRAIDCTAVAYPRCLDVCEGEEVVVSDWTHHNVKIFPKEGATPRVTYSGVSDAHLKAPMGVAWDERGHVLIVDSKACKLHAVSSQTGACTAIFSLPQQTGVELKLITFVDASPGLCSSERALVVTTNTGSMQVYDLCPY